MSKPQQGAYLLRVCVPQAPPVTYSFSEFPMVIGRSADSADIVIDHPSISTKHAAIIIKSGRIFLRDLNSSTGSFKNERRISSPVELDAFDSFFLGDVECRIRKKQTGRVKAKAGTTLRKDAQDSSRSPSGEWHYYGADNSLQGPVSSDDIRRLAQEGLVTPSTVVMNAGQTARASQVEGLKFGPDVIPPALPNTASLPSGATVLPTAGDDAGTGELLCPHCWRRFSAEQSLYIAQHRELIGDPVLGAEHPRRFLPSRFTPTGIAIDAGGQECPDRACPQCHLEIPDAALEPDPIIFSVVGAPSSGKSYFLTAMIWGLRHTLSQFALGFTDSDAKTNIVLHDYENVLFCNSDPDSVNTLKKTQVEGEELYDTVMLNGVRTTLPKPFFFNLDPMPHHPNAIQGNGKGRTLVLYDNAGESFEAGRDSVESPATRHLSKSSAIFFLFDPTRDTRFRQRLTDSPDPQVHEKRLVYRQEVLLNEMIARVRRHTGSSRQTRYRNPLVIVVPKFDVWEQLLASSVQEQPWTAQGFIKQLDYGEVLSTSLAVRELFLRLCPEIVHTAETFAEKVLFVPVSATGCNAEQNGNLFGVRPKNIQSRCVEVPALLLLAEQGLIETCSSDEESESISVKAQALGEHYGIQLPDGGQYLLPACYLGVRLRCPRSDVTFVAERKAHATREFSKPRVAEESETLNDLIDSL